MISSFLFLGLLLNIKIAQTNKLYIYFLNHLKLARKKSERRIPLQKLEEGLPYLLVLYSFQKLFLPRESVQFSFSCCQMKYDGNQPTVKLKSEKYFVYLVHIFIICCKLKM